MRTDAEFTELEHACGHVALIDWLITPTTQEAIESAACSAAFAASQAASDSAYRAAAAAAAAAAGGSGVNANWNYDVEFTTMNRCMIPPVKNT